MKHTAPVRVKSGLPLIATVSFFGGSPASERFVEIEELTWQSGQPIPQSLFDSITDLYTDSIVEQVEDDYHSGW